MSQIKYKSGYKYQLVEDYVITLPIQHRAYDSEFLKLTLEGKMIFKSGYAWDGPSGPAIDTPSFMRGSLVHDALYQIIGEGYLEEDTYRIVADNLLYQICLEDGMGIVRANWVYYAVRFAGGKYASSSKQVKTAP